MTKEEAVERIMKSVNDYCSHCIQHKKSPNDRSSIHRDVVVILTELMEPIKEEEIKAEANQISTNNPYYDIRAYREGYVDGAKWAATRNLKVSLDGLEPCLMADMKSKTFKIAEFLLKSDVEKLVGGTQ